MILPGAVAARLSRQYRQEERLDREIELPEGEPPGHHLTRNQFGDDHLELTVIGETAVLTAIAADELELQAALAYAIVKRRRRRLLEDLAKSDTVASNDQEKRPPFREAAADEPGEP